MERKPKLVISAFRELGDDHHKIPRKDGGERTPENIERLSAREHMRHHGNLRIRTPELEDLKSLIDDREQIQQLSLKINNQLLAFKRRTDNATGPTIEFLTSQLESVREVLKERTKSVEKWIKEKGKEDSLITSAKGVFGVGPIAIAYLISYVDLEKAEHPSSLWAYVYDYKFEKEGKKGGCASLRREMFILAQSFIKHGSGPYNEIYYRTKEKYSVSESTVKEWVGKGRLEEVMWKNAKPGHRHMSAIRVMMKHFLADYWFVGRTLKGLSTDPLYAEAILGHTGIINPRERGWMF